MLLIKPFKYDCALRQLLSQKLPYPLKINEKLRRFSKTPVGETVTIGQLVQYINSNHQHKRETIPANQLYLKHVVQYWKTHPLGTHAQCVEHWNHKPCAEKKFSGFTQGEAKKI